MERVFEPENGLFSVFGLCLCPEFTINVIPSEVINTVLSNEARLEC